MMADKIPDEIMEEAFRLTESAWQLKHPELAMKVARALMARDTAARKECAEIARLQALYAGRRERRTKTLRLRRETYPHEYGQEIATAIEATITGGGDEQR